jgi:hypothetical protein
MLVEGTVAVKTMARTLRTYLEAISLIYKMAAIAYNTWAR